MTCEDFLLKKESCVGVVGTRTDWVLKGEGGAMMTPLLQCVARFDGGGETFGLDGEVRRRVGRGAPCLSKFPSLFVASSCE